MILTDEQFKKYRGVIPWISPSRIKPKKIKSPKHYKYFKDHPEPDTDPKKMGRAFHLICLQPDLFNKEYAIATWDKFGTDPKRNKDGSINLKDKFNISVVEDLTQKNPGKILLMPDEYQEIMDEKESIFSLPDFELTFNIKQSYVETTFLAFAKFDEDEKFIEVVDFHPDQYLAMTDKEKWNYLPLLCRIDIGSKIGNFLTDLKSTDKIYPDEFVKEIETQGYHIQAAMELDIVNAALALPEDDKYDTFYFVCVENKPPYDSAYFIPKESCIKAGRRDYIKKIEWIKRSTTTGIWEGVSILSQYEGQKVIEIDLPGWYYKSNPLES
jgi:hypothetical protein